MERGVCVRLTILTVPSSFVGDVAVPRACALTKVLRDRALQIVCSVQVFRTTQTSKVGMGVVVWAGTGKLCAESGPEGEEVNQAGVD